MAEAERCVYPRCRSTDTVVIYLDHPLCEQHWALADNPDPNFLRRKLGMPEQELPARMIVKVILRGLTPTDRKAMCAFLGIEPVGNCGAKKTEAEIAGRLLWHLA